ncbi:MAG: NrfD/PsrC family molybdoenzyme membrane anchor subunit [Anaerolineae bacterium]
MQQTIPSGNAFIERLVMEPKLQNVWGINHATWFTFMGVAGALFLNRVFFNIELGRIWGLVVADVASLILIGIGGLILIADLGQPIRVLRALLNPRHSWISIGAVADFIFLIVETLFILPDLNIAGSRPFALLPFGPGTPLGMVFQTIAAAAALIVILYPGLVMATPTAIPFWNTTLIPLHFLAYAFAGAAAVVFLFAPWANPAELAVAPTIALVAALITLLLVVAHLAEGYNRKRTARESVLMLMRGQLAGYFLGGVLLLGLIVPITLLLVTSGGWLMVAAVLFLAGNWLSKYTILKVGLYAPIF